MAAYIAAHWQVLNSRHGLKAFYSMSSTLSCSHTSYLATASVIVKIQWAGVGVTRDIVESLQTELKLAFNNCYLQKQPTTYTVFFF